MTSSKSKPEYQKLIQTFERELGSEVTDLSSLGAKFSYREMKPQEHWIQAGDVCNEFCFILDGLLRVYYIDDSGNEVNQHFYQANEVIAPISAIISDEPCQYYIQALESSKLMLADYNQLSEYGNEHPEWLRLEIKMLQRVFVKNARHEARLLLGNAEKRYRWFCKEYPELLERLPQYHIASFLGITPVSLSRLRKKAENK